MADDVVDEQVLTLRDQGRSFAGIARELGLGSAVDANAAFNRALRRHPPEEQAVLRRGELERLDALGERVRSREGISEEDSAHKLRGIERLRQELLAG